MLQQKFRQGATTGQGKDRRQRRDSLGLGGAVAGRLRQVLRQVRTRARWVLLFRAASGVLRQVGDGIGGPSAGERQGSGVLLRLQGKKDIL